MEFNHDSRSELGMQKYQEARRKLSVTLKQEEAERKGTLAMRCWLKYKFFPCGSNLKKEMK